jgi:hypothetical protein
LNVVCPVTVAL